MSDNEDRYDEIVLRLAQIDEKSIKNSQERDEAIKKFRSTQKSLNKERDALNKELIEAIKADPVRAAKYQSL